MKWQTFTPNQAAVLWLMREHGAAVFRDGFRRLSWAMTPGTGLTIDGPNLIRDALLARGLIAASAAGYVLTVAGKNAAPAQKETPQRVAETRLQLEPVWLTDEQMQTVSEWFPLSHGKPRLDDRAILSGIVMVLRENLMWQQAPAVFGGDLTSVFRGCVGSLRFLMLHVLVSPQHQCEIQGQNGQILCLVCQHPQIRLLP